ncbi:MAG: Fe2+-dependent dioxygenase [Colwellia sp.]|nr:Fe2+-dependent dioxygenase [Colwellia sp.]
MFSRYKLLTNDECNQMVADLTKLPWASGMAPGALYREKVKGNDEIAFKMSKETAVADQHMQVISRKVMENKFVRSRIFANNMVNPRFNLYQNGGFYGKHADSAFMGDSRKQVRTDISMTLFLTDPDEYEGGEICLEYASGETFQLKEPKGTMLFYPAGVMHEVKPVTKGKRIAFVAWIESHIQDPQQRDILTEISQLCDDMMATPELALGDFHTKALNVKHNLFRQWWRGS